VRHEATADIFHVLARPGHLLHCPDGTDSHLCNCLRSPVPPVSMSLGTPCPVRGQKVQRAWGTCEELQNGRSGVREGERWQIDGDRSVGSGGHRVDARFHRGRA
jgi:hypothetical protein